jgi:uncharacterized membrane protein
MFMTTNKHFPRRIPVKIEALTDKVRYVSIFVMSIFYVAVGLEHIVRPSFFLQIFPPFLPWAEEAVFWTGIWEMALGVLLVIPQTRRIGSRATIALLVLVYPANIFMVFDPDVRMLLGFTRLDAWVRLFFQIPLILLAVWHGRQKKSPAFAILCSLLFPATVLYFLTL